MTFSVYVPWGEGPFPVLWYLSGLTCTHANVTEKGEFRQACSKHQVIFIAPDTSPRGKDVPDDEGYDFGQGAGFYVDATQAPWAEHFQMRSYIEDELPALIAAEFPADMNRQGITGHSMGGHGALTMGLRHPERFKSVSAFAPICNPMNVPWGKKALSGYLGESRAAWRDYDATALVEDGARVPEILIDVGGDDQFLKEQLTPRPFVEACKAADIDVKLRLQAFFDHSYYFVSTFLGHHIAWHAERLKA